MELKRLLSYTRQAVDAYQMIAQNDHIAVGISGGKDSLTLLYALAYLKRFYPKPFSLTAITVDLGYENFDLSPISELCDGLEVPYYIVTTDIAGILAKEMYSSSRKPQSDQTSEMLLMSRMPQSDQALSKNAAQGSPCSLCARLRKGALNDKTIQLGCNKIAYAHHMDDMIETAFLSMIFEGRFYSFSPITHLDRTNLTVIRPLMYVSEAEIKGFQNKMQFPVVKNPCPVDGSTKRQYVKNLIRQINLDHPGAKKHLFHAIVEGNIPGWPPRFDSSISS